MKQYDESQTEIVTMAVKIPKSSRSKLDRIKGLYGCNTIASTMSSIIDDVSIPDLLQLILKREQDELISKQVETVSDNDITQCGISDEEIHTMWIGVLIKKIQSEAKSYGIEDIPTEDMIKELEKDVIVEYYMMKLMEKSMKPTISPAGEMPDMAYLDEMDAKEERKNQ